MKSHHTLRDIYKYYVADGGTLSKADYKNICCDFNIHIMNKLIYDAAYMDMGNNLSYLRIGRIDRPVSNRRIDWASSNQFKEELLSQGKKLYNGETGEGHKWLVYQTNDYFCRFYWQRKNAKVKNKTLYRFVATRGSAGNKDKLKNHLKEDDSNYLKYKKI